MIPFRDENPSVRVPVVTRALFALNVLFFLYEVMLGARLERFFMRAAVIPALYVGDDGAFQAGDLVSTLAPDLFTRILVAMFLHGGVLHLVGNLLYLWIFGDNVEDRLGHGWFVVFYLASGIAASWTHIVADPASVIPSIGASGAIAGVLGAYVVLYPHAKVLTLLPLGFFSQVVKIPAWWFLGFWFVQQSFSGVLSLANRGEQTGGVAWWAHIGGFVCGLAVGALLRANEPEDRFDPRVRLRRPVVYRY